MDDVIPVFNDKYLRKKVPFAGGAYGNFYKGYTRQMQRKVVFEEQINRSHEHASRETEILFKIKHDNIVQLFDWDYNNDRCWMVLEYCNQGDLYEQCKKAKPTLMFTTNVIRQAATALLYLHSMSIIHRDIQPRNILLDGGEQDTIVKLRDFGLSKIANEEESTDAWFDSKVTAKPLFRAPEMTHTKAPCTTSLDIFSLGLCLESMYHYGQGESVDFLPVAAYPPEDMCHYSFGEYLQARKTSCSIVQYQTNEEEIHRNVKDLINKMTEYDNTERPEMCIVIEKLDQLLEGTTRDRSSTLILNPEYLPTSDRTPYFDSGIEDHDIQLENVGTQNQLPGYGRTPYFDPGIEGHDIRLENIRTQNQLPGIERGNSQNCPSDRRSQCDECCSDWVECCLDCCGCCCDYVVNVCQGCCGIAGLYSVGIAYALTFILLTSLGMWLATDDGYNCELSTGTSYIRMIALLTSILGFTVPIAPLVAACCGGAEVGLVIGVLAFFAHLGMSLYGMDLGCKAWAQGTCEDRIVEFMCTSGAVLGFLAVIVIVSGIIAACRRHS